MTNYVLMERDFIQRTLDILDQYQKKVLGCVPSDNEYEVTLLMNCLLGLLVYPQQLAAKQERRNKLANWLTKERVVDVGHVWGLKPENIVSAGYKKIGWDQSTCRPILEKVDVDQLTMRGLIRNMRNNIAHASFRVHDSGARSGQIQTIVFKEDPDKEGFHLELPVEALETFVRALAQSAVKAIEKASDLSPR